MDTIYGAKPCNDCRHPKEPAECRLDKICYSQQEVLNIKPHKLGKHFKPSNIHVRSRGSAHFFEEVCHKGQCSSHPLVRSRDKYVASISLADQSYNIRMQACQVEVMKYIGVRVNGMLPCHDTTSGT